MQKDIILVDEEDNVIGSSHKLKVHQEGKLHRAFSIFIFNSKNELLLQKRADTKYHSASLWSNTCCSHPKPEEKLMAAAHRRLKEEMGFDCKLSKISHLLYKTTLSNDLIEYEFDHLLIGHFDGIPAINTEEVSDCKWISIASIVKEINSNKDQYTYWFKISLEHLLKHDLIQSYLHS
jgi:isopentenyl-diphosphate delta-isomerase